MGRQLDNDDDNDDDVERSTTSQRHTIVLRAPLPRVGMRHVTGEGHVMSRRAPLPRLGLRFNGQRRSLPLPRVGRRRLRARRRQNDFSTMEYCHCRTVWLATELAS